ncbi:polyphosphate:AMP phosphotransferase [Paramagnetospirillum kuznetsovii]|uniref:Polyphosphate:AMP phosphotransferase n=1 Tax=Paramagnetospirillum kuznetsovii TaxID=2053833 RepID=A0A364P123_9PROT|nr:polyphosphate:AMP phosphotransferase [Paramagnetospirillum kuznetsovii]RAU23021.1 polyphosphate:AMP phosphotransferase [Paramagnetospirillum kuznetsovii]
MFEAAELGRKISRDEFDAMAPELRTELLALQQQLRQADFPVIVLFAGVDGAGKNETVNLINEWMDPRWIVTRAYGKPSDEERERPEFWRYWRDLPPKGKVGLFLSSWYHRPLVDRVYGKTTLAELDENLEQIVHFEKALADEGALILKFWMHLSEKAQKKRLKGLEKDPMTAWQVTKTDWEHYCLYDKFTSAAERLIMHTSKGHAPWQIVEGADSRYRSAVVLQALKDAITKHLANREAVKKVNAEIKGKAAKGKKAAAPDALVSQPSILSSLDMTQKLEGPDYTKALQEQRARLAHLYHVAKEKGVSTALVFEGWDAAGKGGTIRRLTNALNARDYQVIPIAAPTEEERAQHYLWRFWRHVARAGRVTVFDRSWYGRVLVERVEGFCTEEAWRRAYGEINDFEEQLTQHGIVMCKFWLHITSEEQLARFNSRGQIEYKKWKLTDEDWRNRESWGLYEQAVNDMVERTSTSNAPWTLIEANSKNLARVKVMRTVADALEAALGKAAKIKKK